MVTDDLIALIKEKFREGRHRNEIKDELISQGAAEEDIDEAISQIQHEAMKQLPGISSITQLVERFESKSDLARPHMTVLLMIACVVGLLLVAGGLYFWFDPLGSRAVIRDARRQSDARQLQTAIATYYQKNHVYPDSLANLSPGFIRTIPQDPQSGDAYSYQPLESQQNYQLCIAFELQTIQCVNATPVTPDIPIVPTDTPVPDFVPQVASSSGTPAPNTIQ